MACGKQSGASVGSVMLTRKRPDDAPDFSLLMVQNQVAAGIVAACAVAAGVIKAFNRGPASPIQDALEAGFASIGDNQAIVGKGSHKMVKLQ